MLWLGWEVGGWVASWAPRLGSELSSPASEIQSAVHCFICQGHVSGYQDEGNRWGNWDISSFEIGQLWQSLMGCCFCLSGRACLDSILQFLTWVKNKDMRGQWQHPFSRRKVQSFNTSLQSSYKSTSQMCSAWGRSTSPVPTASRELTYPRPHSEEVIFSAEVGWGWWEVQIGLYIKVTL